MPTFESYYTTNPFVNWTKDKVTPWYVPDLLAGYYMEPPVWRPYVQLTYDLGPNGYLSQEAQFSMMADFEPDPDPIAMDTLYVEPMATYMKSLSITVRRYGGKIQHNPILHYFNYYRERGVREFGSLLRNRLGPAIAKTIEVLARNAFHRIVYNSYAMDSAKTDFGDITAADKFNLSWLDNLDLYFSLGENPSFRQTLGPTAKVCLISPSLLYDIRNDPRWTDWNVGTESGRDVLFSRIVGRINNVFFVPTILNIFWNAGTIIEQEPITTPVQRGDGAVTTFAGYEIGEPTATHQVTVAGPITDINVGDIVTIHVTRTSTYGVTNGVDPFSGKQWTRKVMAKTTNTLSFDKPLLWPLTTDLGGGVYGWVTKARHIHAATFITGNRAVVMGMAMPIRVVNPVPVDDFNTIERTSWHGIFGFEPFIQEEAFNIYCAGPVTTNASNLVY